MAKYLQEIENVIEPQECYRIIDFIEKKGLTNIDRDLEKHFEGSFIDINLAQNIYEKIKFKIPQSIDGMQVAGLNDFMRIYKYFPNSSEDKTRTDLFFRYKDPNKKIEKSIMSINIFLNDNFYGGGTHFFDDTDKQVKSILSKVGKIIVFDCNYPFSEDIVTSGAPKYILKTEIIVYKQYPELIPKIEPTAPPFELNLPINDANRGLNPSPNPYLQPSNNQQCYPNQNYHYLNQYVPPNLNQYNYPNLNPNNQYTYPQNNLTTYLYTNSYTFPYNNNEKK